LVETESRNSLNIHMMLVTQHLAGRQFDIDNDPQYLFGREPSAA